MLHRLVYERYGKFGLDMVEQTRMCVSALERRY